MMLNPAHALGNGLLTSHFGGIPQPGGQISQSQGQMNPFTAVALMASAVGDDKGGSVGGNGSLDMRKSSIDSLRSKAKEFSTSPSPFEIAQREVESP